MANEKVHFNGQVVPADQARLSVFDAGFLHGSSVFTTMLARNGKVFRLERHVSRLFGQLAQLRLVHDATSESLTAAVHELLGASGLEQARLRITLSPGAAGEEPQPTTLITAAPLEQNPQWWYEKGIGVAISRYTQNPRDALAGLKTGCYFGRILARQEAAIAGAEEALWFTSEGYLAEACFCNVFLVGGDTVLTPPLDTPCLAGVVREAVIEICRGQGIPCLQDSPIGLSELLSAGEVFLTASTALIRPVVRIERKTVGEERPGAITQRIMQLFNRLLDKECPPRPA
jgi:branched-chain amino acid aminotransferase